MMKDLLFFSHNFSSIGVFFLQSQSCKYFTTEKDTWNTDNHSVIFQFHYDLTTDIQLLCSTINGWGIRKKRHSEISLKNLIFLKSALLLIGTTDDLNLVWTGFSWSIVRYFLPKSSSFCLFSHIKYAQERIFTIVARWSHSVRPKLHIRKRWCSPFPRYQT